MPAVSVPSRQLRTTTARRPAQNRIQQLRDALARNSYKLKLLEGERRTRRVNNVREQGDVRRNIGRLKQKIEELNRELASSKIVTNASGPAKHHS